ncbi:aldehyde dehydrogenase [Roseiarcaceae bacterium H3SJ34-1]|uniref:aldehyde dehydrogenase n=1 Tax=Terripilifer ovatus TaxID=3032367 RepID=UPI003AB9841D|nr:aldehyde dehydrogenase [Roseiarcaceae bacterium H3SJ34-1]
MLDKIDMPRDTLYLGGEWRKGNGAEISSVFPADRSPNATISGASAADVEEAIARAQAAANAPAWKRLKPHERAGYLYRISEGIARNVDRISYIQTRDTGKTLGETRALAMSAAGTFRYFAAVCETEEDQITPSRGDYLTLSRWEPIGVVAAITPWNSPIASDAQKIAPALAAGNAVILKPASWSPLVSLELARIIDETDLPKGLLSVLPGSGSVVGDLLVTHPAVGRVSFTGGTAVGRALARKAAEKLMPVSLELGGKSPTIVFADADIRQTIAGILFGIFSSSGQSCIAGSRLYVERAIYREFVEQLVAATRALKVGHPFEASTQVAPLIHEDHRGSVERFIAGARRDGGNILAGGQRPTGAGYDEGIYLEPTIIADADPASEICREEVFGPVLAVFPFDAEEDVIRAGNDNDYGLACGIWTRDVVKALRVGRDITAGTIWINTYKQFSISTPFGGMKASGVGREKGRDGLRAYMQQKSYYIDTSGAPLPWAGV